MKISRKNLNKLIRRHLINEGILDTISGAISGAAEGLTNIFTRGAVKSTMVKASSEDAYQLFNAMQGLGTTESVVKDIIRRRELEQSLVGLYDEYNNLLKFFNDDFWGKYSINSLMKASQWDGDLISWLEGDGMDEEARLVKDALIKADKKREEVDITLFGM